MLGYLLPILNEIPSFVDVCLAAFSLGLDIFYFLGVCLALPSVWQAVLILLVFICAVGNMGDDSCLPPELPTIKDYKSKFKSTTSSITYSINNIYNYIATSFPSPSPRRRRRRTGTRTTKSRSAKKREFGYQARERVKLQYKLRCMLYWSQVGRNTKASHESTPLLPDSKWHRTVYSKVVKYEKHRRRRNARRRWESLDQISKFELDTLPDSLLTEFCSSIDPTSLTRLINDLDGQDHVKNIETLLPRLNLFSLELSESRSVLQASGRNSYTTTPLVYDTGASYGLTPYRADFIDYHPCELSVKDISKVNRVIGIGTVMYKFTATNGDLLYLPGLAYHLETADIRLFSPQTYHQLYGGYSELDGNRVIMHLKKQCDYQIRHDIEIPIKLNGTNLPMIHNVSCNSKEQREIGPNFRSALAVSKRGFTGRWSVAVDDFEYDFGTMHQLFHPCVSSPENANLTNAQKELLMWHWKLGISMHRIQELMRGHKAREPDGTTSFMPPVIKPKFPSATSCPVPRCESCELARAKKRNPKVVKQEAVKEKKDVLSWNKYMPGDFVSMDQFSVSTPGRRLEGYGRESKDNRYHGGTIFQDAATGIIWVESQISMGAGETIMSKQRFEEWLYEQAMVEIKQLHSDNGVFVADEFKQDCKEKKQKQSFSGVGAQHQNSKAERAIQTIMWMARTFILHVSL